MENDSEKYIKDISKNLSVKRRPSISNSPKQYKSVQKQYMANRTQLFVDRRSYLSTDYVSCRAQGLLEDFYEWKSENVRLSNLISSAVSQLKKQDDYKEVLFSDIRISYFPIGAKLETMGNTWLSINPSNISSVNATSVVARCNASFNSYDYYGKVITEPIVVERYAMASSDHDSYANIELMSGYFNITCQLNDTTRQLGENKRIILGSKPYSITGFTDFIQEFSGDRDSSHLLTFTARIAEPTENDDMKNYVADGKSQSFEVSLFGKEKLIEGQVATFTPRFIKNGSAVEETEKFPLSWIFQSGDKSIATVSETGEVTTIAEGETVITAILEQNSDLFAEIPIIVEKQRIIPYITFKGFAPAKISQYESATYEVGYFENGVEHDVEFEWNFSVADQNSYFATVSNDKKSITVECISPDDKPLVITAKYGNVEAIMNIRLEGY